MSTQQRNARSTTDERPRLVFYGSLSKASDDPNQESIESQLARVRAKAEAEYPDGYVLLGDPADTTDDGYSGSKRDRGPGLERAIELAVAAADEGGDAPVEIWCNTPARFARGTGRKNQARSVLELFVHMQREGVTLRSVTDDDLVRREELVGFASRMAAKYAEDLRESVTRAKVRDFENGKHLGGPVRDGYRIVREHDDEGRVIARTVALDAERAGIWERIFELADEGVSDSVIARRMNAEGKRTRKGRPFDRRAIQDGVTCPFYCGRLVYKRGTPEERVNDGTHPKIVEPDVFDRIQRARPGRDHAEPEEKVIGRPARNHALARLAVCAVCGEPMYCVTSTYKRKDGTRARSYQCHNSAGSTGPCSSQPINAELVDAAGIADLDGLLIDFERWRARIEDRHAADRERLADEVRRAERDHSAQADKAAKVEAKWSHYVAEGDDAKADLVLPIVQRERDALAGAERRLRATRDALATVPPDVPADAMLDFANALQNAVRGRLDDTGSMAEVNQGLRELFAEFRIYETAWAGWQDGRVVFEDEGRRAYMVQPVLRLSVAHRLADWPKLIDIGDGEAPPLRWLQGPTPPDASAADPSHAAHLSKTPTTPSCSALRSGTCQRAPRATHMRRAVRGRARCRVDAATCPAARPISDRDGRRTAAPALRSSESR